MSDEQLSKFFTEAADVTAKAQALQQRMTDAPAAPTPSSPPTGFAATSAALEAKIAALHAQLDARQAAPTTSALVVPAPDDPAYAEIKAHVARDRGQARLAALAEMGPCKFAALTQAQILAMAPDVDPRTPDGRDKLAAWHKQNANLFYQGPAPDPRVEAAREQARAAQAAWDRKPGALFSADRMVDSVFGVTRQPDPAAEKAARRAELEKLQAKAGAMFGKLNPQLLED